MNRCLVIVFTFTLFPSIFNSLLAQENYLPGHIVTPENDTLKGFIDYRNWKGNPETISFKRELNAGVTAYTPTTLKAFLVAGELYESAIVEVEVSPEKVNELSSESEYKISEQTAFLQCLIRGDKSLYYLLNKAGKDNFYIRKANTYELLLYKRYVRSENYTQQVYENKKYPGQLTVYLNDCREIQSKAATKGYKKKDLTKLFEHYYTCVNKRTEFQKKSERTKVEWGLLSGVTVSNLNFSGENQEFLTEPNLNSSIDYTGGFYFDFVLPRNQGKWIVATELIYTNYYFKTEYEDYETDINYTISTTTIKAPYRKLNTMLKFRYPINKMHVFANLGMSNGFMMGGINEREVFRKFGAQETTQSQEAIKNLKTYEQGLLVGVGSSLNQFGIQFRYERSSGLTNSVSFSATATRYYFLISYRLK